MVVSNADQDQEAMKACLVIIYGLDLGKKFNLSEPSLIVGRSSECDIQVDEESVSQKQVKFIKTGDSVVIKDLGSVHGTLVNDKLTKETKLKNGDLVEIGRTIFRFLSGDNLEDAYHEEIYKLTTIDGLTQVYNKRHFIENLGRELSRSRRYGRHLSLGIFSVDDFKHINDSLGHLFGDQVLKQIAMLVRNNIRREDFLARYNEEEFAVILPEIDQKNAINMTEKVRQLVEKHELVFGKTRIEVTISVGLVFADDSVQTSADLIKKADLNLHQAKQLGCNRVVS